MVVIESGHMRKYLAFLRRVAVVGAAKCLLGASTSARLLSDARSSLIMQTKHDSSACLRVLLGQFSSASGWQQVQNLFRHPFVTRTNGLQYM